MSIFRLTSLAVLLLFSTKLMAQSGGVNFTLGFPENEFKDNLKRTGVGLSLEGLLIGPSESSPFGIGLNFGFLNYGYETRRAPFSYTIPDVTVDVERTNNISNFHLLFRIAPALSNVKPYLDLLFGGAYLYTDTKVVSTRKGEEVASSTNFEDWAWSYGAGAGIMFRVLNNYNAPDQEMSSLYVDFKVRYLMGSRAEYLKEGSIVVNTQNGTLTYNTSRSETDMITVHLGVVAYFSAIPLN